MQSYTYEYDTTPSYSTMIKHHHARTVLSRDTRALAFGLRFSFTAMCRCARHDHASSRSSMHPHPIHHPRTSPPQSRTRGASRSMSSVYYRLELPPCSSPLCQHCCGRQRVTLLFPHRRPRCLSRLDSPETENCRPTIAPAVNSPFKHRQAQPK